MTAGKLGRPARGGRDRSENPGTNNQREMKRKSHKGCRPKELKGRRNAGGWAKRRFCADCLMPLCRWRLLLRRGTARLGQLLKV